jgi:hypothetical protein
MSAAWGIIGYALASLCVAGAIAVALDAWRMCSLKRRAARGEPAEPEVHVHGPGRVQRVPAERDDGVTAVQATLVQRWDLWKQRRRHRALPPA